MLSGGAPFREVGDGTQALVDRTGEKVRLLGMSGEIFRSLRYDSHWQGTVCALVSCCDEPDWARDCLNLFRIAGGTEPLAVAVHSSHIYKSNKKVHFGNLRNEYPDIDYTEMLFFDNERWNIDQVKQLGVHSIYCPEGLTEDIWLSALAKYSASRSATITK